MLKSILKFLLLIPYLLSVFATDKVVIQLKWEHEFQFAGYYAADWQGYYKEAGIDVEIRPISRADGSIVKPLEELKSGRANFAVGAFDILKAKDVGVDPVILASFFQRSPTAIFSLKNTPIDNINQLSKLKIATIENDTTKIEVEALFKSKGYNLDKIQFVDQPIHIETLINHQADALVTYEISAEIQAQQKGVELNKLHPADHGLDFYADSLYTTKAFAENNRELVKKFIAATKKGWLYALNNKQQIGEQISNQLVRNLFQYDSNLDYNLAFANYIDRIIQPSDKPIGHFNQQKWLAMNERFYTLGRVSYRLDKTNFFDEQELNSNINENILAVSIVILFILLAFYFWYRKKIISTLVVLAIIAIGLEYQLEVSINNERAQHEKINLLRQLSSISAKLKGNLEVNLSLITGFSAYISALPNSSNQDYDKYSKEIFKRETLIKNFAIAKDLVVNYVYPIKGNEKVIGLDYRKNLAQRDMVLQVINTGQLMVVGPVNLVQGGIAFISRAPIYVGEDNDRKLWGIISSPLDADLLYKNSDVYAFENNMEIAIKSFDFLGNESPVFFGDEAIFDDKNHVELTLQVGGGSWNLAAISKYDQNQKDELTAYIIIIRLIFIFAFLLIVSFFIYRMKQDEIKNSYENKLINTKKMLEKVASVAKIGGWEIDHQQKITHWPIETSLILLLDKTFSPKNIVQLANVFDEESYANLLSKINELTSKIKQIDIELRLNRKISSQKWVRVIANSNYENNQLISITGTIQDVTDKVISARLIEHQATYDPLTNLPNRVLFNQRLTQSIDSAHRTKGKIAVLFIDLDRFKPVNDNHGHQVGDNLLIEAALRIQKCVRETDTVSRLSGDEFGVVLTHIKNYTDASIVAEQVLSVMQKSYQIQDVSVHCGASVGISFYPDDGHESSDLIRKADQAMYEVKDKGRNGWQFYTKEMQQKSEYRHALLNELIRAINKNELTVNFQPIIDINKNILSKSESLVRWKKRDGTMVSPAEFIALAEETGLVNRIDLLMLKKSALIMQEINAKTRLVGLSINVSPRLFQCKELELDQWLENVKTFSEHTDLTVEITERLLTQDSDKALEILSELKSYGIKIAIDDFGTGYSSLNYLVKFPVDIIKIDRSFVKEIGIDPAAETLIKTMIIMAHELSIKVIAEGIETQPQLEFLKLYGCDYAQGYYFSKALTEIDFKKYVNEVVK